ncbi:MAG: arylsulfatase, partial [Pirellulales bacterium]|nr:arylsulfatase [Pirellulales bacterium]
HIDLYKTCCDLAGVKIPDDIQQIDGRTMLPLLENASADWPDRHLFVHQGRWEKGADPNDSKFKNCAVRTQRWRWVNNRELYDISKDPYEQTNVADQHPDVVRELRQAYDLWWRETLPLMVNEDAPYAPHQPQAVRYQNQKSSRGIPAWNPPSL